MKWIKSKISNLIEEFERGISYSSEGIKDNSGVPMMNLACIDKTGFYREGELKYFSGNYTESDKVYPNDMLVACTDLTRNADIIGTPILVPPGAEFYLYTMDLAKLTPKANIDKMFLYYALKTSTYRKYIKPWASGTTVLHLNLQGMYDYELYYPENINDQKKLAQILADIDAKISLNKQINQNLEALAKQLYDYWFVQFDFPDENGKPYKSSGGKMIWNEQLKREIPKGWGICKLDEYILSDNTGDWGKDAISDGYFEVGCIRGADILSLIDLPKRYIKNEEKLLSEQDIVIEVSGGSPTQATGRSAYISQGVIERNGGKITCSNFCHAFTLKDHRKSAYFYYTWQLLYNSGNMFNYEGKTSGIKNFMTEMFLKNYWIDIPKNLANKFFEKVSVWYAMKDANTAEISSLIKQRNELLPLLMNGQVTL